ncbi:uncharacterized protein SETTUDRAFT_146600 [Exserohilum turcica Et28A]|uniref:Uncharacterized protein n=1 Tax=Exserohilum turcicum (strain 28A) TaxID=671987 RepID=R0K9B9_EXST2|nr:uncharacterized protein SETTUDRAFT_146600 [Exserohilum turcica Et28A]EOA89578.1 hypothetical protein SETTUDRAFT_146600 [Exserohilum turcica Et28A]
MSSLFNFVTGQRSSPRRIPTDTIIPLHSRDDTHQNRNISVEFTMRIDNVLDAHQIADALWKLLEKPGWKKLGARLRMNKQNGKLEYHVPAQYTQDRQPINFTQKTHNMRLDEHHIGRRFPTIQDGDQIQVFDILYSLRGLTQTKDSTVFLDDWLYSDKAQLGLHIVNFQDATLVTLTWLHTLLDGMGRRMLLSAWTAVLEGRDEDVAEFWGYDFDPLEKLGAPLEEDNDASKESPIQKTFNQKEQRNRMWKVISATKSRLGKMLDFNGRILYIPASYIARIRREAMHDLASLDPSQMTYKNSTPSSPKPFLSDGDIQAAWLVRQLVASDDKLLQSRGARPIQIANVMGMRDLLSTCTSVYKVLLPKNKAYIGNCATGIITRFRLDEFLALPLGHIAARLRKDLVAQGTREALEGNQRAIRSNQQDNTTTSAPDASMAPAPFVFTNWAKGRFFETDFSAAIVPGKQEQEDDNAGLTRGKPTYIHVYGTDARVTSRNPISVCVGNCIGKDARGGYWLGAMFAKGAEARFEEVVLGR